MEQKKPPSFEEALDRLRSLTDFEANITELPALAAVAERVHILTAKIQEMIREINVHLEAIKRLEARAVQDEERWAELSEILAQRDEEPQDQK